MLFFLPEIGVDWWISCWSPYWDVTLLIMMLSQVVLWDWYLFLHVKITKNNHQIWSFCHNWVKIQLKVVRARFETIFGLTRWSIQSWWKRKSLGCGHHTLTWRSRYAVLKYEEYVKKNRFQLHCFRILNFLQYILPLLLLHFALFAASILQPVI